MEGYEKRLRYLQELEAQIKERRKRKLERIEGEEQSLEAENVELKAQLKIFTELEFDDNIDDSYIEDMQEEIKALRVKWENLEMDNKVFSEKMMDYDAQEKELQNEFSDVAYSELEKK